jgi:hypothetical protein
LGCCGQCSDCRTAKDSSSSNSAKASVEEANLTAPVQPPPPAWRRPWLLSVPLALTQKKFSVPHTVCNLWIGAQIMFLPQSGSSTE